ncbi:alkylhydroperoxidase [Actibacterium mucosum KCTC 23349]|uniref:Alkylhydroperoxidase n=1 Tax=Actibacterium mucosum KCTC 23349 TaxID=1454373 RepID=A0A037ZMM5_9RHOB|nr:carboxymuconolactone decarboxylase family protein [Actibacterium mucosum]KAJ56066.1 alkylhydroperoxidase [Actibacterium mucosum KCTC 23349]
MEPRMDYWAAAPELGKALVALNMAVESSGLEQSLLHLVKLRASQINGCAFCTDMHTREARKDGETEQRLYLTAVWHDSFLFSDREKAALEWTEALTKLGDHSPDDALFAKVEAQFPGAEMVKLTMLVNMINAWNRLGIAFRSVHAAPAEIAA